MNDYTPPVAMTLTLGVRVRTTSRASRELFRRNYYDPPIIEIIPLGSTGKIVSLHLAGDGSTRYDVLHDASKLIISNTVNVEEINGDTPIFGDLIRVDSKSVSDDMWALKDHYPYRDVHSNIMEKTEIYQDDVGIWRLRWNAEYQAIVDEMKAQSDAS